VIIPFIDKFPKDNGGEIYNLLTTKPMEVQETGEK
jgi:hypothetical protein